MNKQEFDKLPKWQQLNLLDEGLRLAKTREQVFGNSAESGKRLFRALSKLVHPDVYNDLNQKETADRAFKRLNELYELDDLTHVRQLGSVAGVHGVYILLEMLGAGEIADVYLARDESGKPLTVKIARSSANNDLMLKEADTLRFLNEQDDFGKSGACFFTPFLHDSANLESWAQGGMNVLSYADSGLPEPDQIYTLREIAESYHKQLSPRHIGWIWRRLLAAIAFPQAHGVLHSAITPDNILIAPVQHGMMLIDWTHSSRDGEIVSSIATDWKEIYPPEVFKKGAPYFSMDLYMAAKCMLWATSEQIPPAMRRYFDSLCLWESEPGRHHEVGMLDEYWQNLLFGELAWKKEYISLDYAPHLALVDWSWWQ